MEGGEDIITEIFDQILHEYNRKKRGQKINEFQISQDSVVVVASYYLGGKNKVTKEFYLFVTWPSGDINLWVVSRSGMGNEKLNVENLNYQGLQGRSINPKDLRKSFWFQSNRRLVLRRAHWRVRLANIL
ncbi:MAG: hypothetical protein IPK68_11735 [Bdellovibrionales bacterium]|nr:hypothetical protein [Bdellovibrionales bacterium]